VTQPPTDAKEDGKPTPSTTSSPTDKSSSQPTHTLPVKEHASSMPPRERSMLDHTSMSKPTPLLNSRLPLPRDQPPSPLRPIPPSSRDTIVEFSTLLLVEPNLTTPSPLSDTEPPVDKSTTLSETPGVLHGEWLDTSISLPSMAQESVESKWSPSGQPPTESCVTYVNTTYQINSNKNFQQ